MRQPTIEFFTFLAVTMIFIVTIIIPGWILMHDNNLVLIMDSPEFRRAAMLNSCMYLVVYVLAYFIIMWALSIKLTDCKPKTLTKSYGKKNIFREYLPAQRVLSNRVYVYGLIFLFFGLILFIIAHDPKEIIAPSARFGAKNPIFSTLSQFLLLTALSFFLFGLHKRGMWILVLISLIFYEIYPIAISSRATVLPFIIIALYFTVIRRNLLLSSFFVWLGALFFSSSLVSRGDIGYSHYFSNIIYLLNPSNVWPIMLSIFPSIGTLALALEMFENTDSFGLLRFVVYVSPLPSFVIPAWVFEGLGFTDYLRATGVGLNTDVISEWVFWFGRYGWIFGGIFLASLTAVPAYLHKIGWLSIIFRLLFQFSIVFFIGAGLSMSVRAASRPFVWLLMFLIGYRLLVAVSKSHSRKF